MKHCLLVLFPPLFIVVLFKKLIVRHDLGLLNPMLPVVAVPFLPDEIVIGFPSILRIR
jgi:hypothetical protein